MVRKLLFFSMIILSGFVFAQDESSLKIKTEREKIFSDFQKSEAELFNKYKITFTKNNDNRSGKNNDPSVETDYKKYEKELGLLNTKKLNN